MGLGITFVLVLLAFNANCDETLDSLIKGALTFVGSKTAELNETINENLKIQKKVQTALRSLESTLSDGLIDIYLTDYVNSLESLYQISVGTNEENCFSVRPSVVKYIKDQTTFYYKICVSRFSKTTAEEELKLSNLDRIVVSTTKSLKDCETNPVYRKNNQLGLRCVNSAKDSFTALIKSLNTSPVNKVNYVEELSKCITNTVNRAEDIIETLNDGAIDCVQKVSNNTELIQSLPELLPNPNNTLDVFKPQTTDPISVQLSNLELSLQNASAELKVLLQSADNAKNKATKNGSLVLLSVFNQTKSKLAEEAVKFESSNSTKSCVAAFQSSLTTNNQNRVNQLEVCVSAAPNPNFDEVKSIDTKFLNYKALDKYTALNCMANINNIFPIGGIKTCIDDKRKEDENYLTLEVLTLRELKSQTEQIEKRVNSCTKIASDTGTRLLTRDISTFEFCIKRATNSNNYKFP